MAGEGILGLDREGRHTFVNPTAASLLGYEVDELLHQDSHQLWHHSHPDGSHYPRNTCPILGVLRHGQMRRCEDETFWRKDGTPIHVDCINTPILIDGEIKGAVVLFRPSNSDRAGSASTVS
jgi:PAS domain S-box-containing protein